MNFKDERVNVCQGIPLQAKRKDRVKQHPLVAIFYRSGGAKISGPGCDAMDAMDADVDRSRENYSVLVT